MAGVKSVSELFTIERHKLESVHQQDPTKGERCPQKDGEKKRVILGPGGTFTIYGPDTGEARFEFGDEVYLLRKDDVLVLKTKTFGAKYIDIERTGPWPLH